MVLASFQQWVRGGFKPLVTSEMGAKAVIRNKEMTAAVRHLKTNQLLELFVRASRG